MNTRRIEYNIPINVAQIAKSNSVDSFVYVSSLGANPTSSGFYLKARPGENSTLATGVNLDGYLMVNKGLRQYQAKRVKRRGENI